MFKRQFDFNFFHLPRKAAGSHNQIMLVDIARVRGFLKKPSKTFRDAIMTFHSLPCVTVTTVAEHTHRCGTVRCQSGSIKMTSESACPAMNVPVSPETLALKALAAPSWHGHGAVTGPAYARARPVRLSRGPAA